MQGSCKSLHKDSNSKLGKIKKGIKGQFEVASH